MHVNYNPLLVITSIAIAMFGAWVALAVFCCNSDDEKRLRRRQILLASVAFAAGTWSMHFVAMLALQGPVDIAFDPLITAFSFLAALTGAIPAFSLVSRNHISPLDKIKAALFLAAAICAMHYSGMYSMRMNPPIVYDFRLVLLSTAIAIMACYGGLHLIVNWRYRTRPAMRTQAVSALLLGGGVSAMHYSAMAAASFQPDSTSLALSYGIHGLPLARMVICSTLLLLLLLLLSSTRFNQFAVGRILAIIAVAEMVAMQVLPLFPLLGIPAYLHDIVDAMLLTVLVLPVAWWLNNTGRALTESKRETEANFQGQQAINRLLALPMMRLEFGEMLHKSLDIVLDIAWLRMPLRGAIYLADSEGKSLSLVAQRNLSTEVLQSCAQIDFEHCCCGKAARQKKIQTHSSGNAAHSAHCDGMAPHGHYAVPLLHEGALLGVLCVYHGAERKANSNEIIILEALGATIAGLIVQKRGEHELYLAETVFRHNLTCLMVTDEKSRILKVNPMFLAVTGYEEREVIGQTPAIFKSGHQDAKFYKDMWKRLSTEGQWEGEIWNRCKGGRVYPEWLSITAVRDSKGRTRNYVASFIDISTRKEAEVRIQQLAYYDPLTSLANRTLFFNHLRQALAEAQRNRARIILMYIDLDRFKEINDTQGHDVGDELLREVAERLRHSIRESDMLARLGGDEFVVILKEPAEDLNDTIKAAQVVAEKIVISIGTAFELRDQSFHCGASIGIVIYPDDGVHAKELLQRADTAMYAAKKAGRGTYQFFSQKMLDSIGRRLSIEQALRKAIAGNELRLYYQPQVDIETNRVVGVEALLRWRHAEFGEISPGEFVPLAEECGLIQSLGEWVFSEVCRQRAAWDRMGYGYLGHISLNVSIYELLNQQFVSRIHRILQEHGLIADKIELEFTESGLARYPAATGDTIRALRNLGFKLAIDDFGTDYSSLSRLKSFDVQLLKIDQSFVRDMTIDSDDAAIVRAIIEMAQALGMMTLAEGVETREQAELLRQYGCSRCQGYYFGVPMPAIEFEELLDSHLPEGNPAWPPYVAK